MVTAATAVPPTKAAIAPRAAEAATRALAGPGATGAPTSPPTVSAVPVESAVTVVSAVTAAPTRAPPTHGSPVMVVPAGPRVLGVRAETPLWARAVTAVAGVPVAPAESAAA